MAASTRIHRRVLLLAVALLAAATFTLTEPPRAAAARTTYSTISLAVSGHGYVSNDLQGVPYMFWCMAPHPWFGSGSETTCTSHIAKMGGIQLRAEPAPGWYFSHWEGDCGSSWQPCWALLDRVGDTVYVKAVFKKFYIAFIPITVTK